MALRQSDRCSARRLDLICTIASLMYACERSLGVDGAGSVRVRPIDMMTLGCIFAGEASCNRCVPVSKEAGQSKMFTGIVELLGSMANS